MSVPLDRQGWRHNIAHGGEEDGVQHMYGLQPFAD